MYHAHFLLVQLPLMVDIIKHPAEVDGKSTAVHARLLAPDHVTIHTYPDIPHFENKKKVILGDLRAMYSYHVEHLFHHVHVKMHT